MQCVRCHADKQPGDFYSKDRTCKTCRCALVRENREAKADYYRAYDVARASHANRMDLNRRVTAEWRATHPERRAAQIALNNAVRDGRVFKWPVCALPECNSKPVAHHPDYSRPLDVVWLCQAHHKQAHALVPDH